MFIDVGSHGIKKLTKTNKECQSGYEYIQKNMNNNCLNNARDQVAIRTLPIEQNPKFGAKKNITSNIDPKIEWFHLSNAQYEMHNVPITYAVGYIN